MSGIADTDEAIYTAEDMGICMHNAFTAGALWARRDGVCLTHMSLEEAKQAAMREADTRSVADTLDPPTVMWFR